MTQLQDISHCMWKDVPRTDQGCLHCPYSAKLGGVWTCWYQPRKGRGRVMTATDELRALLDERGVEHYDHENGEPLRDLEEAGQDPATSWRVGGMSACAVPDKHGTFDIWIDHATPAQAIAATLGRGTCHDAAGRQMAFFSCSACGATINGKHPRYCPGCGREVVNE